MDFHRLPGPPRPCGSVASFAGHGSAVPGPRSWRSSRRGAWLGPRAGHVATSAALPPGFGSIGSMVTDGGC